MEKPGLSLDDFKAFVIGTLNLEGFRPDAIGDDQPLFGQGLGLDSVDALELIVALEKRFEVKIRTEEIDPAAFASMRALHRYVLTRVEGLGVSPG